MQEKLALNLQRLGHAQIEQLTGLRWAAVARAAELYRTSLGSRGRPPIHGPLVTVVVALIKMRLGLSVRALEALTGVDSVTASRCVNRCARFSRRPDVHAGDPRHAHRGLHQHPCGLD